MQPRDLVTTLHVDLSVSHHQAKAMVQARSNPPPTNMLEIAVESLHSPDVSLHRADQGRTVRKKVQIAEEERRIPLILKRRDDCIDGIRPGSSQVALGFEHLRPLWRAALWSLCPSGGARPAQH